MFYAALVLALTMAAVAGGLYFYVMFLEGTRRQQGRRIEELERANAELLAALGREGGDEPGGRESDREWWPEVLDEGGDLSLN